MLRKFGRLFVIKTKWEAWLVIYAIALGAIERGLHYQTLYVGWMGWMLAAACVGVVFLAGGKLLDSVRPLVPATVAGRFAPIARRDTIIRRSRPRRRPADRASARRTSRRID
jgi:hypothetical protein